MPSSSQTTAEETTLCSRVKQLEDALAEQLQFTGELKAEVLMLRARLERIVAAFAS